MQLIYLYVEKYKNIKNQGFNFSSRFNCAYDKDKQKLTIEENDNYIENFFGENIEVTAIVGENGAGKSNLLDLLYSGSSPAQRYFYIALVKNELVVKGLEIAEQPTEIITNNKIKLSAFENNKAVTINARDIEGSLELRSGKFSFVYYSNKFEPVRDVSIRCIAGSSDSDKFNISTANLVDKYTNVMLEMKNSKVVSHYSYQSQYELFISECIQKALVMLQEKNLQLPFESPSKIYIHSFLNELKDPSDKYLSKVNKNKLDFIGVIKYGLLANFLDYKTNNNLFIDPIFSNINIKDYSSIDSIYSEFSRVFLHEHYSKKGSQSTQINPYIEDYKESNRLLAYFESNISKIQGGAMMLNVKSIEPEIIGIYKKLVFVGIGFLKFSWYPNLSTGQENFLFQLANYYDLKNIISSNKKLNKNLLVFIDEGENTFHPNWQKKYINDLIYFFNNNFIKTGDVTRIQFFFATHSPFILSDIPKQNVIFVQSGKPVSAFKMKDTFGANIHTLLSDGFFMQDGLMGEFAKNKINSLYEFLVNKYRDNDKNSNEYAQLDSQNIIDLIGEPILKKELQFLHDKKFEVDEIEKKIRKHEEAIEQLRLMKKDD